MIIDIVVGAVVLISAVISFFRGFIRETLTIAGVAAGGFSAIFFGPKLAPVFYNWFNVNKDAEEIEKLFGLVPMDIVADVCAYAAVFIIVVIIVSVISHFTAGAAKALGLGPIDRTLGVIFGIIRAVLLLSLLYLPFNGISEDTKIEYFGESKTHYYIEKTAVYIATFLPTSEDVKEKANDTVEKGIKGKLLENNFLQDKNADPVKKEPLKQKETGYEAKERNELENLFEEPILNE